MTTYSLFSIPELGMMAQSHAFETISSNVANVSTGGFKATETRFTTLLSNKFDNQHDIGGLRPYDINRIASQGQFVQGTNMDLAINGSGFFVFNTAEDSSGEQLYGRDGAFEEKLGDSISVTTNGVTQTPTQITDSSGGTIEVREGFLVDKNGYYVQGWAPQDDGTFDSASALQSLRVDPYAFTDQFSPTTTATMLANLPAGDQVGDDAVTYAGNVIDSNGKTQSVIFEFTKASTTNPLLWNMKTTTSQDPVAQVDTVTLSGTVEEGDTYTLSVNGQQVSYTVPSSDTTLDDVRDGLLSAIAGNPSVGQLVSAAAGTGTGELTLTAQSAGTSFTTSVSSANGNAIAQVDDIDIGGTFQIGDTYSLTVNGNVYSYTSGGADATNTDAATGLAALIAAGEPAINVTTTGSVITLTAATAGTGFTVAGATAVDGGGTNDQTVSDTATQANVAGVNDQGISSATTTANVTNTTTSAATVLTFKGDGSLDTPTDVALSLTFAGGGTADLDLDISGMQNFAGDFNPISFSHDGYAKANMVSYHFDNIGQVVGTFDDGTSRAIYKLPLAVFFNPNALEMRNGNTFAETETSGEPSIVEAGQEGFALFAPETHELSNVDLADEFTRMIKTQAVYNACATTFRTVDEMTQTARDLKR
jgi:flagellar hook protein FlgE